MTTQATTDDTQEEPIISTIQGTYADILFILFPFLIIGLQRLWNGDGIETLRQPDLSIAAAILAGMSVGKFVLGLVSGRGLGRYKERIVLFIAITLFFVMGPAIILILKIVSGEPVPEFVIFVQPLLLVVAISLYTSAISIANLLTLKKEQLPVPTDLHNQIMGGGSQEELDSVILPLKKTDHSD